MFIYRLFTISFFAACLVGVVVISACTEAPSNTQVRALKDTSQGVSLLALASSDGAALNSPWNAQEQEVLRLAKQLPSNSGDIEFALGAITETATPCADGGVVTVTTDNQGPPWFSEGDHYTTTFTDCVRNNTMTNGARGFSVDVMVGEPYVDPEWTMTTTLFRENLTKVDILNERVHLADGRSSSEISASNNNTAFTQITTEDWLRTQPNNGGETSDSGTRSVTYSWDDVAQTYAWDFNVTRNSTIFGNMEAATLSTLTGTLNLQPEAGQFAITTTDASGVVMSITTVTALANDTVRVEVDRGGDGVIDTSNEMLWTQLLIDPILYSPF